MPFSVDAGQVLTYLKNRPQPRKHPFAKSISELPHADDELSPPVGGCESAAATPAPERIIPPSTAVVARERMMIGRIVSPQLSCRRTVAVERHLPRQRMRQSSRAVVQRSAPTRSTALLVVSVATVRCYPASAYRTRALRAASRPCKHGDISGVVEGAGRPDMSTSGTRCGLLTGHTGRRILNLSVVQLIG